MQASPWLEQPIDRTVRPRFQKRGQQVNEVTPFRVPDVTSQKHLRDAGGRAKIAVNLKRRVRVQQVWIQAAAFARRNFRSADGREQVAQDAMRVIAVAETRPDIQLPTHAPAGRLVAAEGQRLARGG